MLATRESVLAITPDASHRTAGQSHKSTGSSGMRGLALDGVENFGDAQHGQD